MVKISGKATLRPLTLLSLTLAAGLLSLPALGADGSYVQRSYDAQTLGTTSGAYLGAGNLESTQTLATMANVTVLGSTLNALSGQIQSPSTLTPADATGTPAIPPLPGSTNSTTINGTTYTTIYSFGKAVFANAFSLSSNGPNNVKLGLAPTEIRVPFVIYPVGPLTLNVGGGVRFQANLDATLTPEIGVPLSTSGLGVQLQALAEAGGFVEAYASLLIIRGGIGGQVDLLDGQLAIDGQVLFNSLNQPAITVNGIVQFFNGSIYAFLDIFGFLTLGWDRLINKTLYSWPGICYSMGGMQCPAN